MSGNIENMSTTELNALVAAAQKTLKGKVAVDVAEIKTHGSQLVLPEGMSLDGAIDLIKRRQAWETQTVKVYEEVDCFVWDGANALNDVLEEVYGWAPTSAGNASINVEVAYGVTKAVPWGGFDLPGVQGRVETSYTRKNGRFIFQLEARVTRAHEHHVKALFAKVQARVKSHSIYKGKAIKLRMRDENGESMPLPVVEFLNTDAIKPENLIYSKDVMAQVETNLFTPIRRVHDLIANDIPVKRGVLLAGTYGTGKTLAATVASRIAVDNGVTYIYIPHADELADAVQLAKQYQSPASIIFCEDVDRVLSGDRTQGMDDILNIIDGIDTKDSRIMVVLTTNDIKSINPAMLRPGRLDGVVEVTTPDAEAVERLIRYYGGEAISPEADLTAAGKELAGNIPATIAEVVKRAKLAQMSLGKAGEPLGKLDGEGLLIAAKSMSGQLRLLAERIAADEEERTIPPLEQSLGAVMMSAVQASIAVERAKATA